MGRENAEIICETKSFIFQRTYNIIRVFSLESRDRLAMRHSGQVSYGLILWLPLIAKCGKVTDMFAIAGPSSALVANYSGSYGDSSSGSGTRN